MVVVAITFGIIFLAEVADTSGLVTLVLATRAWWSTRSKGSHDDVAPPLRTDQPRIASIAVSTASTTRRAAVARVTQRTGTTRAKRLPP